MKKYLMRIMPSIIVSIFVVFFMAMSCKAETPGITDGETEEETTEEEVAKEETMEVEVMSYSASLSGQMEVPAVTTEAMGSATFMLSDDMGSMSYSIYVDGISDPQAAHIHWAMEGENGPVVVGLFPMGEFSAVTGEISGLLVEGTITEAELAGDLEGMALSDLIAGIIDGTAYVNIHTTANPDGEIRGQLK